MLNNAKSYLDIARFLETYYDKLFGVSPLSDNAIFDFFPILWLFPANISYALPFWHSQYPNNLCFCKSYLFQKYLKICLNS